MKISRHSDGTYSITGMTRNDFGELTYGMVAAAVSSRTYNGIDAEGIAMGKRAQESANRLYNALSAMERAAGSGSIVVTSASCYGDDNAFYIEKINSVVGYQDNDGVREDITSHLRRKES
jgi:hypothetical protein